MRAGAVTGAVALGAASIAVLAWVAEGSKGVSREVTPVRSQLVDLYQRAASAAHGQRVVVVHAPPGRPATGEVFESAQSAGKWALFPPLSDAKDPLAPALQALADHAAKDLAADQAFDPETERALTTFGVALVVIEDGTSMLMPEIPERSPSLAAAPEVPAVRLRKASPVLHLLADPSTQDPADALGFSRGLRAGDAPFLDLVDGLWGGELTIQAHAESDFLFAWPASGARITVDGREVVARSASVPLLVVHLPQGTSRVVVKYGEERATLDWLVIAAAAGLFGALVWLFVGLRPNPLRGEAPSLP